MAKKDHTLLNQINLIADVFNQNASPSELIASAIQRLRRDPDMDLSEVLRMEESLLKDDVRLINEAIQEASAYGLQIEAITSTIQAIREDPELEISIALQYGLQDWDI